MPDLFVPLPPATATKNGGTVFVPFNSKKSPPAPDKTPVAPITPVPAAAPADCGKPTITLERQGEIVSAIRIRCKCGEEVELNCIY